MEKTWTPELWRVVCNGVGGVPGAAGLSPMNSFNVFANGDPDCLSRAAECVNACRDIPDPENAIPRLVEALRTVVCDWDGEPEDMQDAIEALAMLEQS